MGKDRLLLWAAKRLLVCIREVGANETAELIRKNLAELTRQYLNRRFDRKFHVETSGIVQLAGLTCDSPNKEHGAWYEPTPIRTLKSIFSSLPAGLRSSQKWARASSGKPPV